MTSRFPILAVLIACCCAPARSVDVGASCKVRQLQASFQHGNTIDVGAVQDQGMATALGRFMAFAAAGEKQVTIRIDSMGGSIFLGNRWIREIEDLKKTHGMKVTCIVDGSAYSMGAVILESPVCDVRLATPRSTILFHNGSSGAQGTAEELKQASIFLEAINTAMALVVSNRLGVSLEEYRSRVAHADWIMAVPEAIHSNVIDGTVSPGDIAPPVEG